jgi:hypothetical protein
MKLAFWPEGYTSWKGRLCDNPISFYLVMLGKPSVIKFKIYLT